MPRTGRRRSLTIAAAVLATLAAPAAAQAATYTVKTGDGPCGAPSDLACGDLAQAAAAASPNDVFNVSPGTTPYGSATFTVGGVTLVGTPSFAVSGTLTFSSNSGTASKLQKAAVAQPGAAAAVVVSGSSGLEISDSLVASTAGDGVTFAEGTANKIVRSVVITAAAPASATAAARVTSADLSTADKQLVLESTLLAGGAASLSVNTGVNGLTSQSGDVKVILRHVTAAGSTHGLVLDASKAGALAGGPNGNIIAEVVDSIIQNGTTKTIYPGVLAVPGIPPLIPPIVGVPANSVTDTYTRTLQAFDPAAVFGKNYRLRPGSPAINAGGFTAGESTTDIDGQDRSAAPTDQGFDEFVNEPPKAVIEIKTNPMRTGRPVAFDGSKSSDRETGAGGGIVRYHWEFGDGQAADTTTATTTHTYTREGDGTATLTVVDAQGLSSPAASAPIKLIDGAPPVIVITKPTANQKIHLTTRKTTTKTVTVNGVKVKRKTTTTRKNKVSFAGTAKDKSGVKGVVLVVERLSKTASSTAAKSSAATTTTPTKRCTWIDPKKGAVLRSCAKPILILAKLAKDGGWSYSFKSTLKLAPGLYRITVVGQDNAGASGNSAPTKDAIHRFRLVK
ncbi:MAG: hypothetical protein QOE31_630 [Solirubrobacteraceae bacterium]|jgi:hypothetical protein|nr:hypothetical protein [Solirubrobacteraceae bacterium]